MRTCVYVYIRGNGLVEFFLHTNTFRHTTIRHCISLHVCAHVCVYVYIHTCAHTCKLMQCRIVVCLKVFVCKKNSTSPLPLMYTYTHVRIHANCIHVGYAS